MATQAQIAQAHAMAKKYGYTVSPALTGNKQSSSSMGNITEGSRERAFAENALLPIHQESAQERIEQLEMENRLLKVQAGKPQRQSLVESTNHQTHTSNGYQSRNARNRNDLQERVEKYDLAELADREAPLPENFNLAQAIRDFGWLYAYKTGLYNEG
jgi:hypothetical protein